MPDGPMEKGVGAGVAGIPVLPPELMPSSTLTVVSPGGLLLLLNQFCPEKSRWLSSWQNICEDKNCELFSIVAPSFT